MALLATAALTAGFIGWSGAPGATRADSATEASAAATPRSLAADSGPSAEEQWSNLSKQQAEARELAASRGSARTTLPAPTPTNLPTTPAIPPIVGGFPPVPGCDAVVPKSPPPNGRLSSSELCPIGDGHELRADAAATFVAMDAAYEKTFGEPICVTDSYRSYASQVTLYAQKPNLAARPGTSNHGWGLAVDVFCGIDSYSSQQHAWMTEYGPAYGWTNPDWARAGGGRPEPWHWEFDPALVR